MAKRLVFCFDGTWNSLSADVPTNVAKLAQMVRPVASDKTPQIVYYDEGIGTNTNPVRKWWQGITGSGLIENLREAYRFLIFNYEPGDEIFAFGFSRGAFTAHSFVGFIRHAGILDVISAGKIEEAIRLYRSNKAVGQTGEESGQALRFRLANCTSICVSEIEQEFRIRVEPGAGHEKAPMLKISYVGAWDTVAALGVPGFVPLAKWINGKYGFHDAVLTSKVARARHAVALDELRPTFRAVLFGSAKVDELNVRAAKGREVPFPDWELPYQEKWFPGVHGAVGGGGSVRGLSDGALAWVLNGARKAGLELRDDMQSQAFQIAPDCLAALRNESARHLVDRGLIGWFRRLFHSPRPGPTSLGELALPTLRRWFAAPDRLPECRPYRPAALKGLAAEIAQWPYARQPLEVKGGYTVHHGDTLSSIARKLLGSERRHLEIFEENRDQLDDPDFIVPGMVLRISGVAEAGAVTPLATPPITP